MIACGQCGNKPTAHMYGHSMIVDPWGRVIAMAGEEPGVTTAEIDFAYLEKARNQLYTLQNRRENVYTLKKSY